MLRSYSIKNAAYILMLHCSIMEEVFRSFTWVKVAIVAYSVEILFYT